MIRPPRVTFIYWKYVLLEKRLDLEQDGLLSSHVGLPACFCSDVKHTPLQWEALRAQLWQAGGHQTLAFVVLASPRGRRRRSVTLAIVSRASEPVLRRCCFRLMSRNLISGAAASPAYEDTHSASLKPGSNLYSITASVNKGCSWLYKRSRRQHCGGTNSAQSRCHLSILCLMNSSYVGFR